MSTEKQPITRKQARPVRKATFMAHPSHKGEFTPVNARASKWARKAGKRTRLTRGDLKAIASTGKVKVYAWVSTQAGTRVLRKVVA